jgi:PAS domain S-box-containing protein
LFIEDSDDDAMLIEREMVRGGYKIFSMRIDNEPSLLQSIHLHEWDIIFADYVLPQFSGIRAVQMIRGLGIETPCIMISGKAGEETAVEAMKAGASDFLLKGALSRLLPAIERELSDTALKKEKKLIETQLYDKEEQYLRLFETSSDAILILDNERFIECNHQMTLFLGVPKQDIIGKTPLDFSPPVQEDGRISVQDVKEKVAEVLAGSSLQFEWQFLKKDQTLLYAEVTLSPVRLKEKVMLMSVIRDITERKIAERNQKLSAEILEILNQSGEQVLQIEKILKRIKEFTNLQTVGIRLKKEEDFPFYVTSGFNNSFKEFDTNLFDLNDQGDVIRDSNGHIRYACLCGSVVQGLNLYAPSLYTPYGSFVMGTAQMFKENSQIAADSGFRGYCVHEGFESMALIPLKSGSEIIGILHLADKRKNLFNTSNILYFESIGSSIGIALKRLQDEENLRLNEEKLRGIIDSSADAIILIDEEGKIAEWNKAAEHLMGFPRHIALNKFIWDVQIAAALEKNKTEKRYQELIAYTTTILREGISEKSDQLLAQELVTPDGKVRHVQTKLFTVRTPQGYKIGSISRDITELRKAREQELINIKVFEILSQTAMDFMSHTSETQIYRYISEKICELIQGSMVFSGAIDHTAKSIKWQSVSGLSEEQIQHLNSLAGGRFSDFPFPIDPELMDFLKTRHFDTFPNHYREKYWKLIEPNPERLAETLYATEAFMTALSDNTNTYGLVLVTTPKGMDVNKALIETFLNQATVALARIDILMALKKSEVRFNSLFEQNNDIIFTMDAAERIIAINPIGEKLLTGKIEHGIPIKDIVSPNSYKRLREIFMQAIEHQNPFCSSEIELTARNGSILSFQVNFSITYQNQKALEIFGIARNITSNKMLQNQILSKVIETEEREKKAFAAELHDGLGSLLSTINIYVGLLQKKEKPEEERAKLLHELHNLVNEAVANVRFYANSLTPNVLNDFGLLAAIRIFAEKINTTRPGLVNLSLPQELEGIDKIIEINIYRILLELINNSMKYSGADQINIVIIPETRYLQISFTDNGKGFDVDHILNSEVSGMGVKNVMTRVKTINGTCDFESSEGNGVSVHIMIPRSLKNSQSKK